MDYTRSIALLFIVIVISVANVFATEQPTTPELIAEALLSITVEAVPGDTGKSALALDHAKGCTESSFQSERRKRAVPHEIMLHLALPPQLGSVLNKSAPMVALLLGIWLVPLCWLGSR